MEEQGSPRPAVFDFHCKALWSPLSDKATDTDLMFTTGLGTILGAQMTDDDDDDMNGIIPLQTN